MTESEWTASVDPAAMLRHFNPPLHGFGGRNVNEPPSARKLRLFACACCRQVWPQLTDERSREAVEVAEKYADGLGTEEELNNARQQGITTTLYDCHAYMCTTESAIEAAQYFPKPDNIILPLTTQATLLRDIVGNPFRSQEDWALCGNCGEWFIPDSKRSYSCPHCKSRGSFTRSRLPYPWLSSTVLALATAAYRDRREWKCEWCGGTGVCHKAGSLFVSCDCTNGRIHDGSLDNDTLDVLADALEDEGCDEVTMCRRCEGTGKLGVWLQGADEEDPRNVKVMDCPGCKGAGVVPHPILQHLRSGGVHVRGCWAVDLLLGKS